MAKNSIREICYYPHPFSSKQHQNLFTSEILPLNSKYSQFGLFWFGQITETLRSVCDRFGLKPTLLLSFKKMENGTFARNQFHQRSMYSKQNRELAAFHRALVRF